MKISHSEVHFYLIIPYIFQKIITKMEKNLDKQIRLLLCKSQLVLSLSENFENK